MNGPTLAQLPPTIPVLAVVLQGAATGALVGSSVLVRAARRRMRVEPWAVTAAWSLLGAAATIVALVIVAVIG